MQAEVLPFPRTAALAARSVAADRSGSSLPVVSARREYGFADVARLLSLGGEPRTQVGYLRDLARQRGMPLPKNPRRFRGLLQSGPSAISRKSRWCALAIDAWLDGDVPPSGSTGSVAAPPAPAIPPVPAPVRMDMARRARQLAAGGGR